MTELIARVQAALGDAFRVESELGGGGMSRLFLATEASLNRRVVIKLLPPDLASEVSAARCKQEMEFAARLQHPHILPILAAGAREGLLYYIMPYVAGESLRGRLEREGRLSVADATRLLAEVADALAFAHGLGIIHRGIKPENVLSRGKARRPRRFRDRAGAARIEDPASPHRHRHVNRHSGLHGAGAVLRRERGCPVRRLAPSVRRPSFPSLLDCDRD